MEALSQQEQEPLPDFWFLHTRLADSPAASNTNNNIIQLCMFITSKSTELGELGELRELRFSNFST